MLRFQPEISRRWNRFRLLIKVKETLSLLCIQEYIVQAKPFTILNVYAPECVVKQVIQQVLNTNNLAGESERIVMLIDLVSKVGIYL